MSGVSLGVEGGVYDYCIYCILRCTIARSDCTTSMPSPGHVPPRFKFTSARLPAAIIFPQISDCPSCAISHAMSKMELLVSLAAQHTARRRTLSYCSGIAQAEKG